MFRSKTKNTHNKVNLSILVLSLMLALSACGKKDEAAPAAASPAVNPAAICNNCLVNGNYLLTGLAAGTTVYDTTNPTSFQPIKSAIAMNFNVLAVNDLAKLNETMTQAYGQYGWNAATIGAYYYGPVKIDGNLVVQPVAQQNASYCYLPAGTYTLTATEDINYSAGSLRGGRLQATDGTRTILMSFGSAYISGTAGQRITGSNVYNMNIRVDSVNGQPCGATMLLSTGS